MCDYSFIAVAIFSGYHTYRRQKYQAFSSIQWFCQFLRILDTHLTYLQTTDMLIWTTV